MSSRTQRIRIGAVLAALWGLSLIVPATGWGPDGAAPGLAALLLGWIAIVNLQFGWLANVTFLVSLPLAVLRQRPSPALFLFLSAAVALPALQSLGWQEVFTGSATYPVVTGPGYYLWLTAMFGQALWLAARAASPNEGNPRTAP